MQENLSLRYNVAREQVSGEDGKKIRRPKEVDERET